MFDGEQSIRLATNMPNGYLGKGALASDIRWVDANRQQFKFSFRLVSSTYTCDQHLHKFFAHCSTSLMTSAEASKKRGSGSKTSVASASQLNGSVSNCDDVAKSEVTTAANVAGAAGAKTEMLNKLKVT